MNDRLNLREAARGVAALWWIPALLAVLGATLGSAASAQVSPIYRSQATVLVGPTAGAVTHTSTIRASEDLALFYADMARRQIILAPVVERLRLPYSWADLRDRVSAVVPKENLRLVTVTVMGPDQEETDAVANELVAQLVSLSPAAQGSNNQAFINEQADSLKATIKQSQARIRELEADAEAADDAEAEAAIRREITEIENRVGGWQRIYVELIGTEPTSDAGGLQVLDEATAVTDMGRSGPLKQAALTGGVGAVLGVLLAWLVSRSSPRRPGSARGRSPDRSSTDVPTRDRGGNNNGLHVASRQLPPVAVAGDDARPTRVHHPRTKTDRS